MAALPRSETMKIGVISDTHLKEASPELIDLTRTVFSDVDMILHAGDLVSLQILKAFEGKKIVAARGNMDLPDSEGVLRDQETIEVGGRRIGLIHGWGSPAGLEEKIRERFPDVEAIVYGHSHRPANHVVDGVLFFNPGSFASSWFGGECTVGLLHINEEGIRGEIVQV